MDKDDRPPAFQWYPRDFAAKMRNLSVDDETELAYRRALDASWDAGNYGCGTLDEWLAWGRVSEAQAQPSEAQARLKGSLAALVQHETQAQPDGTLVQFRMMHARHEQVLRAHKAAYNGSKGGRKSLGGKARKPRSSHAQAPLKPCLPPASASASASATALEPRIKDTVTRASPAFVRPSLADVSAYCSERAAQGFRPVDPQAWFDHYSSNGWRVGRNPMRDWKAAVRTWERSEHNNGTPKGTIDDVLNRFLAEAPDDAKG